MKYQYWIAKTSGETYAVQINNDGRVIGACGPLHYSDVQEHDPEDCEFEGEDAAWIEENKDQFDLK